jgi:hypothetical protein
MRSRPPPSVENGPLTATRSAPASKIAVPSTWMSFSPTLSVSVAVSVPSRTRTKQLMKPDAVIGVVALLKETEPVGQLSPPSLGTCSRPVIVSAPPTSIGDSVRALTSARSVIPPGIEGL